MVEFTFPDGGPLTKAPAVVIVGAGLAGWRAATTLRRIGHDGSITLIGDERHPPYDRPPLSKQVLAGDCSLDDINLASEAEAEDMRVQLVTGRRVVEITPGAAMLEDGAIVNGDRLLVATGVQPRVPEGFEVGPRVHVLRTKDDAARLAQALRGAESLVILGGGFVGAEVAATARAAGVEVAIVEGRDSLLGGALPEAVGDVVAGWHRQAGTTVLTGRFAESLSVGNAGVEVSLADGTCISAEHALIGFGSVLDRAPLRGLPHGPEGIHCDSGGRIDGLDHMYAAGDAAAWSDLLTGDVMRNEHWSSASDQGTWVAYTMMGLPPPDHLVANAPYFWSDQHGHKIQVLGRPALADRSGWIKHEQGARVVFGHWAGDRLVGVVTLGSPRLLVPYRKQIALDLMASVDS